MKMTEILYNNSEENLGNELLPSVVSLRITILTLIYINLGYANIYSMAPILTHFRDEYAIKQW